MTFISCVSENEPDLRNGLKSISTFAIFFSSKGPYYIRKCHIVVRGGHQSTLAMMFLAMTLFIGAILG